MKNTNFIAIDFETATTDRKPCQLGIVQVLEGNIVFKKSYLIRPPKDKYSKNCISVHGITPEMTLNSPSFDVLWNNIKDLFNGNFVVAHNAAFDLDVLNKALEYYNIEPPILMGHACTYRLTNMALKEACSTYSVKLDSHHDGLCDAECSAKLFLKYLNGEIKSTEEHHKESTNKARVDYFRYLAEVNSNSKEDPFNYITEDLISSKKLENTLNEKRFIITGETSFPRDRAYEVISMLGGTKNSSISKKLDYAIIGDDPGPKKMKELNNFLESGVNITLLTEKGFICMISDIFNK